MAQNFLRWRFVDPFDTYASTATYLFPLNPNAMTSPFPRRQVSARATTAINGRQLLIEGARTPTEWTFSGDFMEANHYEALRSWVLDRTGRSVYLYDHFGRRLTVVPVQFSPTPKRVIGKYYRHTYEITALVLDITGPTFRTDDPSAPTVVRAVGGYERATITWEPPISAGGAAVLNYNITDTTTNTVKVVAAGDPYVATFTGLTEGEHTFTVQAANKTASLGSPATATATVKPFVGPSGITIKSVASDYTSITFAWTPPTDTGGAPLTGYRVTCTPAPTKNSDAVILGPGLTKYTFATLVQDREYTLTLTPFNAASKEGATLTIPGRTLKASAPSIPVITSLTATKNSITVAWVAPVRDGGLPVAGYDLNLVTYESATDNDRNVTVNAATRSYTFTGLVANRVYLVYVNANNGTSTSDAGSRTIRTDK